jgi:hypothetical protein
MNDFFSDPAWKLSTLLAAAFGGFLTIWIGRLFGWMRGQFSEENRRLFREAKAQVEARREGVLAHLAANPILLVLNTLYVAMISAAVVGTSYLLFSLPSIVDSHSALQAEFRATFCPIETNWLKFLCNKPWPDVETLSNQNTVRYLRIAAPVMFGPLLIFFVWLWSTLYWLFKAYHRAMREHNVAKPFF